nr:hypothetical protein [Tanacetum cinerariifolium]
LPPRPVGVGDAPVDPQALAEWTAKYDRHNEVACLMLGSMTPRLYQQFEHKTPLEMYNELYQMYGKPLVVELQELIHLFHTFDPQALAEWTAKYDRHNEVASLMLGSMTSRLYQ